MQTSRSVRTVFSDQGDAPAFRYTVSCNLVVTSDDWQSNFKTSPGNSIMKSIIASLCCIVLATAATAGPLEEKKAEAHLQAVAAGDVETLMRDYAEDAYMDWVGGPLDGRYRGKAAIREVWQKFAALNEGQPRAGRFGKFTQQANSKGATVEAAAEYVGKTTIKVQHVLVYRDGELSTEIWQTAPALKVGE